MLSVLFPMQGDLHIESQLQLCFLLSKIELKVKLYLKCHMNNYSGSFTLIIIMAIHVRRGGARWGVKGGHGHP